MSPTYTVSPVHIGDLRAGDTVLREGRLLTVSRSNLKHGGFAGSTLEGDSYLCGTQPVMLVKFINNAMIHDEIQGATP
jgi:hypothetical protein